MSGTIKVVLPKLLSLVEKSWNLNKDIMRDAKFLEDELGVIVRSMDAQLHLSIEDLRELAQGIEDCIDSVVYRATWKKQASLLRRSVRSPKALLNDRLFAQKLQRMKQMVVEAHDRRQRYPVPAQTSGAVPSPSSSASDPRLVDADLVGVDEHRAKLLEQLAEAAEGQPMQQIGRAHV